MAGLGVLASGVGQVLSRTMFLQTNTATGIPIPLCVLDVVKSEAVDYDKEISEHPVEAGTETGDHQQIKNVVIRLKGTISSTPLDLSVAVANIAAGAYASFTTAQARSNLLNSAVSQTQGLVGAALQGNASDVASSAFAASVDAVSRTILIAAFEQTLPFTVITRRQRFDNVIIKKLSFPRDESTGYALAFEIDIKQIRIVSPLTVQKGSVAENVISTAAGSTNLGSQATNLTSTQTQVGVAESPFALVPGMGKYFGGT